MWQVLYWVFSRLCCFLLRVLFEGDNDFCVCVKESFPNLKVGGVNVVILQMLQGWLKKILE